MKKTRKLRYLQNKKSFGINPHGNTHDKKKNKYWTKLGREERQAIKHWM
jgi:hypothetical protein